MTRGSDGLGLTDLLGLGLGAAVTLAVGMGLGWLVDALLGTFPVFLFVGLGLGVVGAVAYATVQIRKYLT
ncbi:MAG: AtpZ/AtpI family protein [Jatrophihabitans sp.]|uniref:AtpZ/AtpI family protein n=1 Tax=Jatrophihabitans sp. TaxID=1932789 RepID=UPI003F816C4C